MDRNLFEFIRAAQTQLCWVFQSCLIKAKWKSHIICVNEPMFLSSSSSMSSLSSLPSSSVVMLRKLFACGIHWSTPASAHSLRPRIVGCSCTTAQKKRDKYTSTLLGAGVLWNPYKTIKYNCHVCLTLKYRWMFKLFMCMHSVSRLHVCLFTIRNENCVYVLVRFTHSSNYTHAQRTQKMRAFNPSIFQASDSLFLHCSISVRTFFGFSSGSHFQTY